jgi:hypothetical protein
MFSRLKLGIMLVAAGALAGCATTEKTELGEGKQEFEAISQGGLYRFQYVADGADGYRTVLWRQGASLSDDGKDGGLVSGVVKAVFKERFCSELKLPVSLAEGSPSPLGQEGKWTASLRCAEPPPKPKPEKRKPEAKPKPKPAETAETAGREAPEKTAEAAPPEKAEAPAERKPPAERRADAEEKPAEAKPRAMDGPMECTARKTGDGFDCRPLRR